MAQTMYTHVRKCENDKIKEEKKNLLKAKHKEKILELSRETSSYTGKL
jgi:hypothetical protein